MRLSRRAWRTGIASLLLGTSVSAFALDTVTIAGSALSLDCTPPRRSLAGELQVVAELGCLKNYSLYG